MIDLFLKGIERFELMSYRATRLLETADQVPKAIAKAFAAFTAEEAAAMLGKYQPRTGPYPAWEQLSDETLRRRADAGINPNDEPLLETGAMRDSLSTEDMGREGNVHYFVVGFAITPETAARDNGLGIYPAYHELEFGTMHMPPRPTLGPAVMHVAERFAPHIYNVVHKHFSTLSGHDFGAAWDDEHSDTDIGAVE